MLVDRGLFPSLSAVFQQGFDLLRQQNADLHADRAALQALLCSAQMGLSTPQASCGKNWPCSFDERSAVVRGVCRRCHPRSLADPRAPQPGLLRLRRVGGIVHPLRAGRIEQIINSAERLAVARLRGELRDDLFPGLRNLTLHLEVYRFRVRPEQH